MNYNTFVKLRGLGCATLVIAPIGFLVFRATTNKTVAPPPVAVSQDSPPAEPVSAPPPVAQNQDANGLSDVDREVLRLQKEPLSNGTADPKGLKWRIKQGGVVIELRCDQDKGYETWNRAKVDANNNKQFDETWAFKKDGTIERRVAPNDDQNYTQTFVLNGETWAPK